MAIKWRARVSRAGPASRKPSECRSRLLRACLVTSAVPARHPCRAARAGADQFRPSGRRLPELAGRLGRSGGLRAELRARPALPRLEFNYPTDIASSAVCWLKNSVPARVQDNCCVSGVRGAGVVEPRNSAVETWIDRAGGDYRNFEIKSGESDEACKSACAADNKCRAWTFARAGLCRARSALFPEKGNQAAAAQGRVYLRRGAVDPVAPP